MKIFRLVILLALTGSAARGVIATLAASTQTVTFTGMGNNPAGEGTSRVTWGACSFDGTNTNCKVSGPYTGLGNGGTYSFDLVYPGNGPSPLNAISNAPGSDFIFFNLTAGSFGVTFTPTGGSPFHFYDLRFNFLFVSPTCTGVSNCSVSVVGASTGGTITGAINGSFDTTPIINAGGVVTATDYGGFSTISPATFVEIYGLNLATNLSMDWSTSFNGNAAPLSLNGTTVTVGGQPAYVELASPHQVNVLVPSTVSPGPQPVVVTTVGGNSAVTTVNVNAVAPGLLAPPQLKLAAGQYVFAVFPDNKTFVLPPNNNPAIMTARAKPGNVVILYGLGFGPVTPNLVAGTLVQQSNSLSGLRISIGGVEAAIQFAGLVQGYTGLYQFNVLIPNLPANDATPFTFTLNGTSGAQTLIMPIGN